LQHSEAVRGIIYVLLLEWVGFTTLHERAYMCEWVKEEKIETQLHTGCSFISASYFETSCH
jgi:hypothetical protein